MLVPQWRLLSALSQERAEAIVGAYVASMGTPLPEEERRAMVLGLVEGRLQLVVVEPAIRPLSEPPERQAEDLLQAEESLTWAGFEVRTAYGELFPGARVRVTLPDGTQQEGKLDAQSRWRCGDVRDFGPCAVEILELGARVAADQALQGRG